MHVLFQENAWVDVKTAVKIAELYRCDPAFSENLKRLLICDNLDAHPSSDFKKAMLSLGELVYLPANVTDLL